MGETTGLSGSYRVEVSGWDLRDAFFVEKTDLLWTAGGEKKVFLRRALQNGAVIFIRLANPITSCNAVPVAYRVENVLPMNCAGQCEMRLRQLHPRLKESVTADRASELQEPATGNCEPKAGSKKSADEEILHEA